MPKKKDYTGMRFGMLTALYPVGKRGEKIVWRFRCDCGNEVDKVVCWVARTKQHGVQSCGCITRKLYSDARKKLFEKRLAQSNNHVGCKAVQHPLHSTWASMKTRCYDKNARAYRFYGARGIRVCNRWRTSFDAFVEDMGSGYVKGLTLDRIDSNGNYEPANCRWATPKQQANNTRRNVVVNGKTLMQLSEETGISYGALHDRYRHGKRGKDLIKPVRRGMK